MPRRVPARPRRPRRPCSSTVAKPSLEGGPVLEVECATHLLPPPRDSGAPRAFGHRLVDGLEVVDALGDEERQRGPDEQVVDVTAQLAVEPGHLGVVEDGAPVRVQHAGCSRVDDHQLGLAEVSGIAPPIGLRVAVDPLCEVVEDTRQVELADRPRPVSRLGVTRDPLPAPRPRPAPRATGCPVLVDPVGRETADDPLVPPGRRVHPRCRLWEVFQSSRMSWSSKIIALGRVEAATG